LRLESPKVKSSACVSVSVNETWTPTSRLLNSKWAVPLTKPPMLIATSVPSMCVSGPLNDGSVIVWPDRSCAQSSSGEFARFSCTTPPVIDADAKLPSWIEPVRPEESRANHE